MLLYTMGKSYIRLNNKFVVEKQKKYIQTNITDPDEWMAKHHSDKCIRLRIDQNAVD